MSLETGVEAQKVNEISKKVEENHPKAIKKLNNYYNSNPMFLSRGEVRLRLRVWQADALRECGGGAPTALRDGRGFNLNQIEFNQQYLKIN